MEELNFKWIVGTYGLNSSKAIINKIQEGTEYYEKSLTYNTAEKLAAAAAVVSSSSNSIVEIPNFGENLTSMMEQSRMVNKNIYSIHSIFIVEFVLAFFSDNAQKNNSENFVIVSLLEQKATIMTTTKKTIRIG